MVGGLLIGLGFGTTTMGSSFLRTPSEANTGTQPNRSAEPSRRATDTAEKPNVPAPISRPTIPLPGPAPAPAPATKLPGPAAPPPNWTPTAIRIPRIKVDSLIQPLGVDDQNTLQVPKNTRMVGWWSGGAQPGQPDPAVLVGHRDSRTGPAVFYRLGDVVPGDVIEVLRADGSTARYMVERVESFPKTKFPTTSVYGSTDESSLRLITCFGAFDDVERSYVDNLVVYANIMP